MSGVVSVCIAVTRGVRTNWLMKTDVRDAKEVNISGTGVSDAPRSVIPARVLRGGPIGMRWGIGLTGLY